MSDNQAGFWPNFGKFAMMVTVVGSLIAIYAWFAAPSTDVQATVDRGNFHLPPRYPDFEKRVQDALSPKNLEQTLSPQDNSDANDKSEEKASIENFSDTFSISRALLEQVNLSTFPDPEYRGYWEADVVNTGNLTVKDVSLRLPGGALGVVSREDGTKLIDSKGPVFELGELGVNQKVTIVAWTDSYSSLMSDSDEPNIYHSSGSGTVTLTYEPSFKDFFMANFGSFIIALAIFAFSLPLVLATIVNKSASKKTARAE